MNTFRSLLLGTALVGSLTACGDDPVATPMDSGMPPADTGTMGDASMMGGCVRLMGTAAACPSRVTNNAMTPSFRITQLNISTPRALASNILTNVVNGALARGDFLWGISFDLGGNTMRTGPLNVSNIMRGTAGQGLLDGTFAYHMGDAPMMGGDAARWNPINSPVTAMGNTVSMPMMVMGTVRLPIYNEAVAGMPRTILTELPLQNARMHGMQLAMDRNCIGLAAFRGGRFDECEANQWNTSDMAMTPYGIIEADITVADARAVTIPTLMTTLCNLLAGGTMGCAADMAMWPNQPDAMVGGMPAYHLRAAFSAVSANISNAR